MFFSPSSYYTPAYTAYHSPSAMPTAYGMYGDYDAIDPRRVQRARAARLAAAEADRQQALLAKRAALEQRRRDRTEAQEQLLREMNMPYPRETVEAAQAKKKARQHKMRVVRNAAASRIAAAYRGHHVRRHEQPRRALRAANELTAANAALDALEMEVAHVYAAHVNPAKAAPTADNAHIASEHLMRQLLKLDELTSMPGAGADAVRSRRKALSQQLNLEIEELDRLSEELSHRNESTTQDELSTHESEDTSEHDPAAPRMDEPIATEAHDATHSEEEEDADMQDAEEELASAPTVGCEASIQPTVEELQRTIRELTAQNEHLRKLLAIEQLARRKC